MINQNHLNIKNMLLVGSTVRNIGKTTFASSIINKWKDEYPIIGLKITTIHDKSGKCQHGNEGCGICTNIKDNYVILEEKSENKKDTGVLLSSGAMKVYWIRSLKDKLFEAINEFLNMIPKNTIIVCESNTLRKYVKPGVFVMMTKENSGKIKETALNVINEADFLVDLDLNSIDDVIGKIKINNYDNNYFIEPISFWAKGFSLVILAGGKSSRMGSDKADLKYDNKSFLEILIEKGRECGFSDIVISGYKNSICGITPVKDEIIERGPLGGMYSAFNAVKNPYCLVLSVDIPKINIKSLVPMAQSHIKGDKGATLLSKDGKIEPLIGIYNADLRKNIYEIIKDRSASVLKLFDEMGYNAFNFEGDSKMLQNINTKEDYESL